jgi:hypothetical protein
MDADELANFQLAAVEFATQHRVYCSNLECVSFIVPENIDSSARHAHCTKCGTETCSRCLTIYHDSSDCPGDSSLRQTKELAKSLIGKSVMHAIVLCNFEVAATI